MDYSNMVLNDLVNQLTDFADRIEVLYSKILKERELKKNLIPIKSKTKNKTKNNIVYKSTHK